MLKLALLANTQMSIFKSKKTNRPVEKAATKETKSSAKPTSYGGVSLLERFWRSEKGGDLTAKSQYVFLVTLPATKPGVRKEVEKRYGVKVLSVNMIRQKGKIKRLGGTIGRRSDFKKAIVTLKQGDKIDIT